MELSLQPLRGELTDLFGNQSPPFTQHTAQGKPLKDHFEIADYTPIRPSGIMAIEKATPRWIWLNIFTSNNVGYRYFFFSNVERTSLTKDTATAASDAILASSNSVFWIKLWTTS